MTRRPDVRAPRDLGREAEGVVDLPRQDLVVADQAGQNGQAGSVRRCPAGRPKLVTGEVIDGAGAGMPGAVRLGIGA